MLLYRAVATLPRWCRNLESFFPFFVFLLLNIIFLYFFLHVIFYLLLHPPILVLLIPAFFFSCAIFISLARHIELMTHGIFLQKQGPLQRIPGNSTYSVGLFVLTLQPMLSAWNVPSTCPPIEQELVEQCRLLLLALPSAAYGGEESDPISSSVAGTVPTTSSQ